MTDHQETPVKLKLWPSLLTALFLATFLSYKWLTRGPEKMFDFRLLLAPIYIPLAFGIIWPVVVGVEASITRLQGTFVELRRHWVAMFLFLVSILGWTPIVIAEKQASDRERAELQRTREQ